MYKEVKGMRLGEMASEFRSMMPRLCHEMFDIIRCAFGDSLGVRQSTKMAGFEVTEHFIARHAGYYADEFAGSLRLELGGAAPGAF